MFKDCKGALGGAIGRLGVDFIVVSKTQTEEAFTARGSNFARWGAPWLQVFIASSFAKPKSAELWSYGNRESKSRTVTSLICVDFGHVRDEEAEELVAFLVHMEEEIRKRQAQEMAPPEDRALLAKKQAVSHVLDCNRPDNKAKDRRKCGICGHVGHDRATCPNRAPAHAMQNLPSAPVHAYREATK
eukprot:jgi/Tetstr1/457914/TSEL_044432.t1